MVGAFWDGATFEEWCQILDRTYGDSRLLSEELDPDFAGQERVSLAFAQYSLAGE